MIHLLLTIACTVTINVMVKLNELKGANRVIVLASNYIVTMLMGWSFALASGIDGIDRATVLLGLGGGLLWPTTFVLHMWGVRHYGISLAGTVSRLSLSLPVLFAVVFLNERLTPAAMLGILGCFGAFFLLAPLKPEPGKPLDRRALWYFPALVFCFGFVDLWANLFNTLGPAPEQFLFLVLIFTVSGILTWGFVIARKLPIDRNSFVRGLVLGVPNFGSTYFMLQALKSPFFAGRSAIIYALYSVVPATLIFAMGPTIWREKVTRTNVAGFAIAIAAILLLTLR